MGITVNKCCMVFSAFIIGTSCSLHGFFSFYSGATNYSRSHDIYLKTTLVD